MMKKILGSTLVASTLLLTACGYTPDEQAFYDKCKVVDANKIEDLKNKFATVEGKSLEGKDVKAICESIISKKQQDNSNEKLDKAAIAQGWKNLIETLRTNF